MPSPDDIQDCANELRRIADTKASVARDRKRKQDWEDLKALVARERRTEAE